MDERQEKEALARLAGGDPAAFAPLYEAHCRPVYALALRLARNYEDAEEATQDAFMDLSRLGAEAVSITNLRAWLLKVVSRRAVDLLRRRASRTPPGGELVHVEEIDLLASATPCPRDSAVGAELATRIRQLAATLPERQQAAFTLRHYHALPLAAVAETMGLTEGAVKAHLFQATAKLREQLQREGFLNRKEKHHDVAD